MYSIAEQEVIEKIKKQLQDNNIMLYIKGSPSYPQCTFSAHAIKAVQSCGKPFAFINILENSDIRSVLPKYAEWPTFPQLWIKGKLIGGCDIIVEMNESGELKKLINSI